MKVLPISRARPPVSVRVLVVFVPLVLAVLVIGFVASSPQSGLANAGAVHGSSRRLDASQDVDPPRGISPDSALRMALLAYATIAPDAVDAEQRERFTSELRAAVAGGSPRAWVILASLAVARGETLPDVLRRVDVAWSSNPSFREAQQALEWAARQRGESFPGVASIVQVRHFGAWPDALRVTEHWASRRRGSRFRKPGEARGRVLTPDEALDEMASHRWNLLNLLTLASNHRAGNVVVIGLFRSLDELQEFGRDVDALAGAIADRGVIFLGVIEHPNGAPDLDIDAAMAGQSAPVFVAETESETLFRRPGFARGGLRLVVDPDRRLVAAFPAGVPLTSLASEILALVDRTAD